MSPEEVVAPRAAIKIDGRSSIQVVVVPDNEDRFVVTMMEAARACQRAADEQSWKADFDRFLIHLHEWAADHAADVSSLLVKVCDGALNILVCTAGEWYNTALDDVLTDLDLALVGKFPWLVADVMQVPGSVAKSDRLPFEKAIVVYGDGSRPPVQG